MPSPIPTVEATCPSCGQLVGNARTKFCPHCGATFHPSSPAVSGLKLFGAICLLLLAVPLGAAGGCFLLFSGALDGKGDWSMMGIAAALLLATILCMWGFVKLVKR